MSTYRAACTLTTIRRSYKPREHLSRERRCSIVSFAVDTNVLLRSIDNGHVAQPIAQNGLFALRDRREILSIFPQNLIEFWADATRPVINNGLGLSVAQAEVEVISLKTLFALLPDTAEIFSRGNGSFSNIKYPAGRLMTLA